MDRGNFIIIGQIRLQEICPKYILFYGIARAQTLLLSVNGQSAKPHDTYCQNRNRDPKACRDRAYTHLDPKIVKQFVRVIREIAERLAVLKNLCARISNLVGHDILIHQLL